MLLYTLAYKQVQQQQSQLLVFSPVSHGQMIQISTQPFRVPVRWAVRGAHRVAIENPEARQIKIFSDAASSCVREGKPITSVLTVIERCDPRSSTVLLFRDRLRFESFRESPVGMP